MQLWSLWWSMVAPLAAACSHTQSFLWLATALAGLCTRSDLLGVSSFVRALGLAAHCYDRLLGNFHSPAVDVDALSRVWTRQVLKVFSPYRLNGRIVLLGDGLKAPKSGRKMPAVKRLHQVSDNNTKPPSIPGHSIQAISLLAVAAGSFVAVPLTGRIHEGVKFTNRDQRTLPQKFCTLIDSLGLTEPFVLIADAYYACSAVGSWLRTIREGLPPSELVTATALRNCLPQFLADSPAEATFTKFLRPKLDPAHCAPWRLAS